MKAPVDYSDAAIEQRLRRVSQLRALCLSLAKARPKTPAPEEQPSGAGKPPS